MNSDGNTQVVLNELVVKRELDIFTPIADPKDKELISDVPIDTINLITKDLNPIVLNASWVNGQKIVAGRVDLPVGVSIKDEDLSAIQIEVYYTTSHNLNRRAKDTASLIGTTDLIKINHNDITQYVFELKEPSDKGGYVTAKVVFKEQIIEGVDIDTGIVVETQEVNTIEYTSKLAKPIENSTVTITETGDQSDTNSGDGICDYSALTGTQCTLRAAIEEVNALVGTDNIHFNITTGDTNCLSFVNNEIVNTYDHTALEVNCLAMNADPDLTWWRIQPISDLPTISTNITLDARTQAGFTSNTAIAPLGLNGQPVIEVNCSSISNCIKVQNGSIHVYGLAIPTGTNPISLNQLGSDSIIRGNYIGTDISGMELESTTQAIRVNNGASTRNIYIGGLLPSERNLINSTERGIWIQSDTSYIYGNLIGRYKDSSSLSSYPQEYGVIIDHDSNNSIVGSSIPGGANIISGSNIFGLSNWGLNTNTLFEGNIITDNAGDGIYMHDTANNTIINGNQIFNNTKNGITIGSNPSASTSNVVITQNNIYNNGKLGIDLANDGVTLNDISDSDTGPNNLQNYPLITSYKENGTNLDIYGSFDTITSWTSSSNFRIEFFSSTSLDSSGYGEGETFLGFKDVITNPSGIFDFNTTPLTLAGVSLPAGHSTITAIATKCSDQAPNDGICDANSFTVTSEFGTSSDEYTLSGTIYEDPNADGDISDGIGINAGNPVMDEVKLYRDNGDNIPNNSDPLIAVTTRSSGDYSFQSYNGTYWVVVEPANMYLLGLALPDQTFASAGGVCSDTSGGTKILTEDGECFGGKRAEVSDDLASGLASAEHVTKVTINGKDISEIDFGFSYEVITNTNDAGQGSLRQFITNSTSILHLESEFKIPTDDISCLSFTNDSTPNTYNPDATEIGCTNGSADPDITWWRIQPITLLPAFTRDTALKGETQESYTPSTAQYPDLPNGQPVIEISCSGLQYCLQVNQYGADVTMTNLVINSANTANIDSTNSDNGGPTLLGTYIGTDISGKRKKGNTPYGINIFDSDVRTTTGTIVIGDSSPINMNATNLAGSEIRTYNTFIGVLKDGTVVTSDAGIKVEGIIDGISVRSSTLVGGDTFGGIYITNTNDSTWRIDISNNTLHSNANGIWLDNIPTSKVGEPYTISNNTIINNSGKGIIFSGTSELITFSENLIYNNGGLAIDLGNDGVTTNDSGDGDTGPNNLTNYPSIDYAYQKGANLIISFNIHDRTPGSFNHVEFFSSSSLHPLNHGDSEHYLGSMLAFQPLDYSLFETGLMGVTVPAGDKYISATVTECFAYTYPDCTSFGATSELSISAPILEITDELVINSTGDAPKIGSNPNIC